MKTAAVAVERSGSKTPDPLVLTHARMWLGHAAEIRQMLHHSSLQPKLTIGEPNDKYEQEADRMSEQVMRMEERDLTHPEPPPIQRLGIGTQQELAAKPVQRLCTECEEEAVDRKAAPTAAGDGGDQELRLAEARVDSVSGGQPLTNEQRAFFEPRFGVDFRSVRIPGAPRHAELRGSS